MSAGKLMGLFHSLLEAARPHITAKQVVRFALILCASLYIDYLLPLFPVCQLLTTPYELLFCPILMKIYIEEGGFSFWEHVWSVRSLYLVVLAAIIVILLEAVESRFRS